MPKLIFNILLLLFVAIVVFLWQGPYFSDPPPLSFSGWLMLLSMIYLVWRCGATSVSSIVGFFLVGPPLAVILASALGVSFIAPFAVQFQTRVLFEKAVFSSCLFILLYVYIVTRPFTSKRETPKTKKFERLALTTADINVFFGCCFLIAVCSWLAAPGPTIIDTTYSAGFGYVLPGTQFAPAVVLGSWCYAYYILLRHDTTDNKWMRVVFIGITALPVIYLGLHGRRVEGVGIGAALVCVNGLVKEGRLFDQGKVITVGLLMALGLLVIGPIRNTISLGQAPSLNGILQIVQYHNGYYYVEVPGGANYVFLSQLVTHSVISEAGEAFLGGTSYLGLLMRFVPTNVYALLDAQPPPTFYDWVTRFTALNGGTYIVAPLYGNFGVVGVAVGAGIVGGLTRVADLKLKNWSLTGWLGAGIGLTFIVSVGRFFWYDPINFFKVFLAFVLIGIAHKLLMPSGARKRKEQGSSDKVTANSVLGKLAEGSEIGD